MERARVRRDFVCGWDERREWRWWDGGHGRLDGM
jgi:hypothetical protein